jgi:DNA-binding Lrp family transcriptional regulator
MNNYGLISKTQNQFLSCLTYWSTHSKSYGVEQNGRVWIYNTLEQWAKQLGVSKRTVQRTTKSLKELGVIDSANLSSNKRDRTLFYSINYEKLQNLDVVKENKNDHMVGHMYNRIHKQVINKSYKSQKDFSKKSFKEDVSGKTIPEKSSIEDSSLPKPKTTTVQDMVKELKSELPELQLTLNKNLAKEFVAAFKIKFKSSMEEWRKFLKLIKTSAYLMSEKFKLTIGWILKFSTIDRLKLGELGVKVLQIFDNKLTDEELQTEVEQRIFGIEEPENHKVIRKQILEKFSKATYLAWFKDLRFVVDGSLLKVLYPSKFIEETIKIRFSENFKQLNILL